MTNEQNTTQNIILELKDLDKVFTKDNGKEYKIIDKLNLQLYENEILGIIGRSGCGKSTILRMMSGLIEPSGGKILYHNEPLVSENARISMIFQTFALFPWLTVSENISIALESINTPIEEIPQLVKSAVKLVGLEGFETAYPKEISGGMRQRVGFARAMVVKPEILLMDEAFSALDYLTSDTLRMDLLDLWYHKKQASIKSIVMVTHSIEEAIRLCDRVVVLSPNGGGIISTVKINLEHPRSSESKIFQDILNHIYGLMTLKPGQDVTKQAVNISFNQNATAKHIMGLLRMLKKKDNQGDNEIGSLSKHLKMGYNQLLELLDTLSLFHFIDTENGFVKLTTPGNIIATADRESQRKIFAEHLIKHVYFAGFIYRALLDSPDSEIGCSHFFEVLFKNYDQEESHKALDVIVGWGAYADLFNYNEDSSKIGLNHRKEV